jgi:hypothetical protein
MTRRLLMSSLVVGLVVLGGINAQAGGLPTTLDTLLVPGATAVEGNFTFSNFGYTTSPANSPPAPADVSVTVLSPPVPGLTGITFNGAFFAAANTMVDYAISYMITVAPGTPAISDAYLALTGGNFNGTGKIDVSESLFTSTGAPITTLDASIGGGGSNVATAEFGPNGYTTILVTKDLMLFGGSEGATVSFVSQGFSIVPEPSSMALLGIGLSGLFTLRRFFKRTSVA